MTVAESQTTQETVTSKPTIRERLEIAGKRPDVILVSLGSFLLLSLITLFGIDLAISTSMTWLALSVVGYTEINAIGFAFIIRILGFVVLGMSIWIGLLGVHLHEKRPGEIMAIFLKVGIVIFVFMAFSIGIGILTTFLFFFWEPKQMLTWSKKRVQVYHSSIIGIIVLWMFLELLLTEDNIGVNILRPFLSASAGVFLYGTGLEVIALSAAIIVVPLYILFPKLMGMYWKQRRGIEEFWKDFIHDRIGIIGFLIIVFMVCLAVFAPFIAPYHWSYFTTDQAQWFLPPSIEHPFGTNHDGGDIFSRIIWGTQISLLVGFVASIVAVVIGTLVGLISGYYGGLLDTLLMRITDVFLCLPTLPLMLIFLLLFGQGLQNVIIVIAILGWTGTARMVRSEALSLRERPLTEAAHAIGASDNYIVFKHILPNVLPLILANVIIGVVSAILSEAGISFLGFMPIHGQPSWGIVLYWASRKAALSNEQWWWIVPPGLFIMLTTLGFAFVSHAADKVVNPRLRGRL